MQQVYVHEYKLLSAYLNQRLCECTEFDNFNVEACCFSDLFTHSAIISWGRCNRCFSAGQFGTVTDLSYCLVATKENKSLDKV